MYAISLSIPFDAVLIVAVNVLWQITLVLILALSIAWLARTNPAVRYWVLSSAILLILCSPITSVVLQAARIGWIPISFAPISSQSKPDATYLPDRFAMTDSTATRWTSPIDSLGAYESDVDGIAARRWNKAERVASIQQHQQAISRTNGHTPDLKALPSFGSELSVPQLISNNSDRLSLGYTMQIVGPWVMLLWCLGTAWMLLRLVVGYARLIRIVASAKPNQNAFVEATFRRAAESLGITLKGTECVSKCLVKTQRLLLSQRIDGPIAAGLFRPCIILPENLIGSISTQQLRDILIHEMAHVVRKDQILAMFQNLVSALFWIHPLIRVLNRQLSQAREEICDNYVLSVTDAPSYSRTLLEISELVQAGLSPVCSVGLFTSTWKLEHRIIGLLDTSRNRMTRLTAGGWMFVTASLMTLMMIATFGTFRMVIARSETPNIEAGSTLDPHTAEDERRVFVQGIVLKPDGMPAIGATVRSSANVPSELEHFVGKSFQPRIAETKTDEHGGFKIEVDKRPFGDVSRLDDQYQEHWKRTQIVASMSGYGPNWFEFKDIANEESVTLKLVEDIPIRGRIIDTEGRPVANVQIRIEDFSYFASEKEDLSNWFEGIKLGEPPWIVVRRVPRQGDLRLAKVPIETTSSANGTFEIRGLGRERIVRLAFMSDTVAQEVVTVATRSLDSSTRPLVSKRGNSPNDTQSVFGAEFVFTAQPARVIIGQILDADSKKPLSDVEVQSRRVGNKYFNSMRPLSAKTDGDGRFRFVGMPKGSGNVLMIRPNDDQPYLMREVVVPDPAGIDPVPLTIELKRGTWITGKVVDKITRLPIEGVGMHYIPYLSNTYAQARPEFDDDGNMMGDQFRYKTNKEGDYRIVGLPGRAVVGAESVLAPYRDGVGYEAIKSANSKKDGTDLFYDNPITPGPRWPNLITEINPNEDVESMTLDFELDPGASIQVKLVDESNRPIEQGAEIFGLSKRNYFVPIQGKSEYVIKALDRHDPRHVYAHHHERNIGRVATIGPDEIDAGHIELTLLPCAKVSGRLMKNDTPWAGIVIEPRILPVGDFSARLPEISTDSNGRFECNLLPGCRYQLFALGDALDRYAVVSDELEIQPGIAIDFGNLELQPDKNFVSKNPVIEAIRDSKSHSKKQQMMEKK